MLDIISTEYSTEWLSFPSLTRKCVYPSTFNQVVDFQVIPNNRNVFAVFNKKSSFELLRAANKAESHKIQRLMKGQVDDLSCGAVSKMYGSELAIGTSTGFIKIFSVESNQFLPFKFRPDQIGNSVIGLDYSCNDEHLAAAYDSGDVGLFNMNGGVKTNVFNCNGPCTVVKCHPSRAEAMAVGSFKGAITVFDIETKYNLFFEKHAHKEPAQDIAMCAVSSDVFASCGYDAHINVYDMRRKAMMQQHKQPHPLSTICLSPCGGYCAVGNVKGEVYSFDFRNLKEPLSVRCVHKHAVIRVAFISAESAEASDTPADGTNATNADVKSRDSISSTGSAGTADLAAQVLSPYNANTTSNRRDSWASLLDIRGNNATLNDSRMSRLSLGLDASRRQSFGLATPRVGVGAVDVGDNAGEALPTAARRSSFTRAPPLSGICEEQLPVSQPNGAATQPTQVNAASTPISSSTDDYELAVARTAKLADVFETMRIKREAEEICAKSKAYVSLKGYGNMQEKYLNFIEEVLASGHGIPANEELPMGKLYRRSMARGIQLLREMQQTPKVDNPIIDALQLLYEMSESLHNNNNNKS